MKTISKEEFLKWADEKGLCLDTQYPRSAVLTFQQVSESRFWEVPRSATRRPSFIARLVELLGDWQTCHVWRHLGSWPAPDSVPGEWINDVVLRRLLQGLGLALGSAAVVEFERAESDSLISLLFLMTVFGRSVGDDLYVVPDHARQLIKTDHHDVIHVSFADAADVRPWVSQMKKSGFALPDELPDATFKPVTWVRGEPPTAE